MMVKVKSIQRSETEAIRIQIQPSKPKREITKITNSQNTKRKYDQPSEQLFPKRWPLSNPNRTKHNIKRHRNSDTKNRQQRTTTHATNAYNNASSVKCLVIIVFFMKRDIPDILIEHITRDLFQIPHDFL